MLGDDITSDTEMEMGGLACSDVAVEVEVLQVLVGGAGGGMREMEDEGWLGGEMED